MQYKQGIKAVEWTYAVAKRRGAYGKEKRGAKRSGAACDWKRGRSGLPACVDGNRVCAGAERSDSPLSHNVFSPFSTPDLSKNTASQDTASLNTASSNTTSSNTASSNIASSNTASSNTAGSNSARLDSSTVSGNSSIGFQPVESDYSVREIKLANIISQKKRDE